MGAMRSWIFDRGFRVSLAKSGDRNTLPSDALYRFLKDGLTVESGI